ncbi:hypothetical protein [Aphanothece sacrum]|uniref:DUF4276 domain-containing protein n=1 Tax=Aphanothece sacrum FPU1 TaxID=1920663 RepID=A0A401IL02_APHSA|nr:hypothetical protein [Aphanothece sacrum]GBF81918.1 hypothetical protein AsFPU1_3340 [Aphanothece sacrum FPU1]GBF83548.1 hypothetical protein AsFPU3_0590 [Aphanothece sacrum FPU3]
MSQNRVQIVILCEDRQQEVFARYFLEQRGFNSRFRAKINPPGSQSGEQYVRTEYAKEVQAYRQNKNRISLALVVIIDADQFTVEERLNQLANTLKNNRQPDEAIAIFIPKRNIETWIHHLQGTLVDETTSYGKFVNNEASCKGDIKQLVNQCYSQNLPNNVPPSLQKACEEFQRLLPLLKD